MDTIIPQEAPQFKQCYACGETFPATRQFFYSRSDTNDKLTPRCKTCYKSRREPYWKVPEGYKRCSKCKEVFPATHEFFYKATRNKGGFFTCCRKCHLAMWRAKHPLPPKDEAVKEGHKRCTGCKKIWMNTHEFFCKDKNAPDKLTRWCRECIKRHRDENKEYRNAYNARYGREHKEERKAYQKEYLKTYAQRPEVQKRQHDQWRIRSIRRRVHKKDVPGTLTQEEVQNKLRLQHYACYYCSTKFEKRKGRYTYHLEHTIPLSRTECNPRHDINYVVLACPHCNITKYDKLPHEFFEGGRLF